MLIFFTYSYNNYNNMVFGIVPKIQNYVIYSRCWSPRILHWMKSDGGPFTIFFWCPWFKWGIVLANIKDFEIPAQNISIGQQIAISLTGFVWSRYATQIYPFGLNLFMVNFFMGCSGIYQLSRK